MKRKFAIRAFLRSELDDLNRRVADLTRPPAKSLTPVLYLEPPAESAVWSAAVLFTLSCEGAPLFRLQSAIRVHCQNAPVSAGFTPQNATFRPVRAFPTRPAPSNRSAYLRSSAKLPAPPEFPHEIPQTFFLPKIGRAHV